MKTKADAQDINLQLRPKMYRYSTNGADILHHRASKPLFKMMPKRDNQKSLVISLHDNEPTKYKELNKMSGKTFPLKSVSPLFIKSKAESQPLFI